ncbi:unnamed protein product, partial [Prunus brigantina]
GVWGSLNHCGCRWSSKSGFTNNLRYAIGRHILPSLSSHMGEGERVNLQLEIEEQEKYLEKMFEQQRKMEDSRVKPASSTVDDHATSPSNLVCPSPREDKPETSKDDHEKTLISTSSASTPLEEGSQGANRKNKQKA